MSFGGSGGGSSSIATSSDVALSSPADGQVLSYNDTLGKWQNATNPSAPVTSVNTQTGAVVLAATDVGLGNVDDTSDADKPVSDATQTALDAKATTSSLATVATSGSYTDLTSKPTIPTVNDASTGAKGIVQLAGDLAGTATAPTLANTTNVSNIIAANTTVAGAAQKANNLSDLASASTARTNLSLDNVDNTSDLNKPISNATQTALDAKADTSALGTKMLLIDNAAALPPGTPAGVVVVVKS